MHVIYYSPQDFIIVMYNKEMLFVSAVSFMIILKSLVDRVERTENKLERAFELIHELKEDRLESSLGCGSSQVWDVDLEKKEDVIEDIIRVAQGEMVLEESLKEIRESLLNYQLDFINYQSILYGFFIFKFESPSSHCKNV